MEFIEQECDGKIENIFDNLHFDHEENVLYLLAKNVELDEVQEEETPQGET